jgi:hypothetical protein
MKLVIIESPYAGEVEANVAYARACMRDSLGHGEAPIASHLLYTQPGILCEKKKGCLLRKNSWSVRSGFTRKGN